MLEVARHFKSILIPALEIASVAILFALAFVLAQRVVLKFRTWRHVRIRARYRPLLEAALTAEPAGREFHGRPAGTHAAAPSVDRRWRPARTVAGHAGIGGRSRPPRRRADRSDRRMARRPWPRNVAGESACRPCPGTGPRSRRGARPRRIAGQREPRGSRRSGRCARHDP